MLSTFILSSSARNGAQRTTSYRVRAIASLSSKNIISQRQKQREICAFPTSRLIWEERKESSTNRRQLRVRQFTSSLLDTPKSSSSSRPYSTKQNRKDPKQPNRQKSNESSSLAAIHRQTEKLNQLMNHLDPLPLTLQNTANGAVDTPYRFMITVEEQQIRETLFSETKKIVENVLNGVREEAIQPARKHGPELSLLFGNILKLYSAALPRYTQEENNHHINNTPNQSAFEECINVLHIMDQWNLSRQAQHYHYAILTAIHEQRWKDASKLFWQQSDPDVSGFTPIEISVSSPVGLYAIARSCRQQQRQIAEQQEEDNRNASLSSLAVEEVLDAAVNLSLISPADQEKCKFGLYKYNECAVHNF